MSNRMSTRASTVATIAITVAITIAARLIETPPSAAGPLRNRGAAAGNPSIYRCLAAQRFGQDPAPPSARSLLGGQGPAGLPPLDCVAGDAVLIVPVSRQIPC